MRRLNDGAFAVVAGAPRDSHVASIAHPKTVALDAAHAAELRELAHGMPDTAPEGEAFIRLRAAGLALDGLPADDPVVQERLRVLGTGFAWHGEGCPDREALTVMLRRLHARRKMSLFDFGQTAVLPECGIGRCWQLTQRAGKKQRVLLIGDDDLLALPLAALGHQVTVVDIDDVLIDFIQKSAREFKLKVDARVQDVLAPMPKDMVGAYDVVLTDPMSYESCLVAFLSRATSAVKHGGLILTCVHPLARRVFERVARRLPVGVEEMLFEFNGYYYQGFVNNWYRSDLYVLRRGDGPDPHAPEATIPFTDIIAGNLGDRLHSFTDVYSLPFNKPTLEQVRDALDRWEQRIGGDKVLSRHGYEGERYAHEFRALDGGGHLSVTFDKHKAVLSWDLFPFQERWDEALGAVFAQFIRAAGVVKFNALAPDLGTPPVELQQGASPKAKASKRPAAKKQAKKQVRKAAKKPAARGKRR